MTYSPVNTIWVLIGAALVFFMQAGFSMCEAGFTRAKNTGNILMKNLMDFCIGTPCFWLVGFGIMFGTGTALFGWIDPMIMKDYSHRFTLNTKNPLLSRDFHDGKANLCYAVLRDFFMRASLLS